MTDTERWKELKAAKADAIARGADDWETPVAAIVGDLRTQIFTKGYLKSLGYVEPFDDFKEHHPELRLI